MKRLLLILVAVVSLSGCSGDANAWRNDCLQMGGIPILTHNGTFVDRYECFVDNEQVTVPGWEGN